MVTWSSSTRLLFHHYLHYSPSSPSTCSSLLPGRLSSPLAREEVAATWPALPPHPGHYITARHNYLSQPLTPDPHRPWTLACHCTVDPRTSLTLATGGKCHPSLGRATDPQGRAIATHLTRRFSDMQEHSEQASHPACSLIVHRAHSPTTSLSGQLAYHWITAPSSHGHECCVICHLCSMLSYVRICSVC